MRFFFKYVFISLVLWMHYHISFGQDWYPVNFPTDSSSVLPVFALHEFNDELYVGGQFAFDINGTKTYSIAKWNGTKWDSLSVGIDVQVWFDGTQDWHGGEVNVINHYNNELYIGGNFRYVGLGIESPKITKWDGGNWKVVNTEYIFPGSYIGALQEFQNKLFAGGIYYNLSNDSGAIYVDCCIAVLNENKWEKLPGGDMESVVNTFIYKDELYVGGGFWTAGGVPVYNVAHYDGTQWEPLEQGTDGYVTWFEVDSVNDKLFIAGGFSNVVKSDSTAIYCEGIAIWDGTKWSAFPQILGFSGPLTVYHGKLYCGGYGQPFFAAWNAKNWEYIGGPNTSIASLGIYHDTLYAGGYFKKIINANGDTLLAPGLIRWWSPDYCDSVHAIINILADTVPLSVGDSLNLNSLGFSNQWEWDFGDEADTVLDTSQTPLHNYDSIGIFTLKLKSTYGLCPWDMDSLVVVVSPVGINETMSENMKMKIYPNPNRDSFAVEIQDEKLKLQIVKLEIVDVKGKLVFQFEIKNLKTDIKTAQWEKGVYFVNLISEGKVIAKEKIVVEW